MTSVADTITVTVPSFATVTLTPAPDIMMRGTFTTPGLRSAELKSKTLRVPITASMTVRELAKGAMMRYILSLRRTAKEVDDVVRELCRSGIAVTDVYLLAPSHAPLPTTLEEEETGNGGRTSEQSAHMIELLSNDCVVQVVQVMKETVHMRFRAANGASVRKGQSSSLQAAVATEAQSTDEDITTEGDSLTTARAEDTSRSISIVAPPAVATVGGAACSGSSLPSGEATVKNAAALHCAPNTFSDAAQESSSTPVAVRQRSKNSTHNVNSTQESSNSEGEEEKEAWQNIARSIATLREREAQRIRWGPDAHKHFAANYVSSPEKIMIGRFKCGRCPPPVVQLHPTQPSSSASSQGSISEVSSSRSLGNSRGTTETGDGCLSPRPVIAQESSKEHLWYHEHEHRESPQPLTKRQRCDTFVHPSSKKTSINRTPEVLASSNATESERLQVTASLAAPISEKVRVATEEATAELQPVSSKNEGQEDHLCSAATPVQVAARSGTSPWAPSTVAKPVVAVVARQLSFDEDVDTSMKRTPAVSNYSANPPVGSFQRVTQG
ncbi:hypothetical protein, unknown function [Leishmania tarentolae]|uniref:Uncharacterized protein n=1 Tax=Leishmania tarentolae TaxID=5689 RepID=A0A640KTC0_LEITA|nr:hypothetical protein, unknown function [Leishmania tarentolae]